jgi:transcription antitermination factor NusG
MLMASNTDLKRHALRLAKEEWGGKISGMKLRPIAPLVNDLIRDDEAVSTVEGSWFAVATEPREETHVSMGLCAIGVPYLPVEPRWENHGRGQQRVIYRPFITGYLFLKCVLTNQNWHAIMATRGVRRMLSDVNGKPKYISDREMDAIRAAESHFFWVDQERERREQAEAIAKAGGRSGIVWHFSKGDIVKISKGPLAGFYAELVEAVDPHDRIRAIVKLFASSRVAQLSAFDLERPES